MIRSVFQLTGVIVVCLSIAGALGVGEFRICYGTSETCKLVSEIK